MDKTIQFKDWKCILYVAEYSGNHRTVLQLLNAESIVEDDYVIPEGTEMIAICTVNLPDEHLEKDEVCIKDYSENEGMLKCLVDAKVISEPIRYTSSGHVSIPICKLLKYD